MTSPQDNSQRPRMAIIGVRGVPAAHGGFETFAARLAPYLAANGWDVSVYCQEIAPDPECSGEPIWQSTWQGVKRVHIAVGHATPLASIRFDWACIGHAIRHRPDVVLMLGYNTAVFALRLRLARVPTIINMDGMEWRRAKWSLPAKAWLFVNDWAGCLLADHLIADHPRIKRHLRTRVSPRKITVIPYGTDSSDESAADTKILRELGLTRRTFATLIARPEPENSILDMVTAFAAKRRGLTLVVLGNYRPDLVPYHAAVRAAAGNEVRFLGAVYDKAQVEALRRGSLFYLHGHQVGGCNPSLLEAMGAGNPVIAHDNPFNRWVARDGAMYFVDQRSCERMIEECLTNPLRLAERSEASRRRARLVFRWSDILQSYADLLADVSKADRDDELDLAWVRRPYPQIYTDAP